VKRQRVGTFCLVAHGLFGLFAMIDERA